MDAEVLAELKAYLDEEIDKRSYELEVLKKIRELVERELKSVSFKSAAEVMEKKAEGERVIPLISRDGKTILAELHVERDKVRIVPSTNIELRYSSPPISSFFIGKVLTGIAEEDERLISEGKLSNEERLKYEVNVSGDVIKEIVILNYRDQRRLNRIKEAARWSFQKAYDQEQR